MYTLRRRGVVWFGGRYGGREGFLGNRAVPPAKEAAMAEGASAWLRYAAGPRGIAALVSEALRPLPLCSAFPRSAEPSSALRLGLAVLR